MSDYRPKDAARHIGTGATAIIVVFVLALIAGSMWVFGWGLFRRHTADYRGETGKRERVNANPDYRIAAYDHFYDLCAQVQSTEASIANLETEARSGTDPQRRTVIHASITALRNSRAEDIAQYNADARKAGTLGQFRASDLPYQLDPTTEETQCTASTPSEQP